MSNVFEQTYSAEAATGVFVRSHVEAFAYSDGDEAEQRIADAIRQATDLSTQSDELERQCVDWPSRYHLSGARANLLRPYEHLLRGDILEIGAGCGAMTRYLGESGANVTALEGSHRRASIAASRNRDLTNVNVVCDHFSLYADDRKFDVVTLIGVLEYARMFDETPDAVEQLLARARSYLKPEGVLILAIENKLGLKYFAGAGEDHVNHGMYGVESLYRPREPVTFGHEELDTLLASADFGTRVFAYPFPDYKLPVSVVLPAALNEAPETFNGAAFAAESAHLDGQLALPSLMSLELAWQSIGANGLLGQLANSFLVISSPASARDVGGSNILAYHYGSRRAKGYARETVFYRLGKDIRVRRHLGGEHVDSITPIKEDVAYIQGYSYRTEFARILARPYWTAEDVVEYFRRYVRFLATKYSVSSPINIDEPLTVNIQLRPEAVDILPHNIMVVGEEFSVIDIEHTLARSVSVGYVLFRAVIYSVNALTRCGYPNDFALADRATFVSRIFDSLFGPLDAECFDLWWIEEANFQHKATGNIELRTYDGWCAASFPILDSSSRSISGVLVEVAALRMERARTSQDMVRIKRCADEVVSVLAFEFSGDLAQPLSDGQIGSDVSIDLSPSSFGLLEGTLATILTRSHDVVEKVNDQILQLQQSRSVITQRDSVIDVQRAEAKVALRERERLIEELRQTRESLSWRITAPLRMIKSRLRRIFR